MRSADVGNVVPLLRSRSSDTGGDVVGRMVADLIHFEATGTESDAIRSLMATRRYGYGDIATLLDEALAAARQQIVAAEMARAS